MRLLCTVKDSKQAENLHDFLTHQGISNQIDKERNSDWGSDDYGAEAYHVWIIDEDQAGKAYALYEDFLSNPPTNVPKPQKTAPQLKAKPVYKKASLAQSSPITFYLLVLCCLLFSLMVRCPQSLKHRPIPLRWSNRSLLLRLKKRCSTIFQRRLTSYQN